MTDLFTMRTPWPALAAKLALVMSLLMITTGAWAAAEAKPQRLWGGIPQAIVVRTTENITEGGWVWILNQAKDAGISRIYLLVKQDENDYASERTKRTLASGELLVSLPGETTAQGWDNSDWLKEMLTRARADGIEVFAWFPVFQDAIAARDFPTHVYAGANKEAFVDPAVPAVRARQEALIGKLILTYAFDGIALDWVRYNARTDGSRGPLAERFEQTTGKPWSEDLMKQPLARATWDDLRAATVADWIAGLTATYRQQKPALKWGAFVLPWQFKEVAQSYRRLGDAGLDYLQPMIYWSDWKEGPHWTRDVLQGGAYWLADKTAFWPTFDLNDDEKNLLDGVSELSAYRLAGQTWYLHEGWSDKDFALLRRLGTKWGEAGGPVIETANDIVLDPPAPPPVRWTANRLEPALFAADASVWTLVCLAELYKQGAIGNTGKVVPILAFHRFAEGQHQSGKTDWVNSTAYLDELFGFLKKADFNTVSTSDLQGYMVSEDPEILPKRPIALTIDDGSASIIEQFHPRAMKHGFSYAVALITNLVKDQPKGETLGDYQEDDLVLTSAQARELLASGKVELLSHTHNLHFYGPEDEAGKESGPAMTTRLWLKDRARRETKAEWQMRIFNDLVRSRQDLDKLGARGPAILTWPYGEFNATTKDLARQAGFNGFLSFANSGFAIPRFDNETYVRVSVMRADEAVPLKMPADAVMQQRWWLAFLKWCRRSASAELIEGALARLDGAQRGHPEAELSRAALEVLKGWPDAARLRVETLTRAYPHDATVHAAVDDFLEFYEQAM